MHWDYARNVACTLFQIAIIEVGSATHASESCQVLYVGPVGKVQLRVNYSAPSREPEQCNQHPAVNQTIQRNPMLNLSQSFVT